MRQKTIALPTITLLQDSEGMPQIDEQRAAYRSLLFRQSKLFMAKRRVEISF